MNFLRRLRYLFRRRQTEAEMAEEMRFHLDQRAADFASDGQSPDEARFAAQRKFGNLANLQQQAREGRGWTWLEHFVQDLNFAARNLRRAPLYTALALITLGLGIGANTAMFSLLNSTILRPLPYAHLDQLDQIYRATADQPKGSIAPADFSDLQRARPDYGDFAAYRFAGVNFAVPDQPAYAGFGASITANLFELLGVQPQLGRSFLADEVVVGSDRVVILSQRLWRLRFSNRPDIIGQDIRVDGEIHRIVGVMPESFNEWRHLGAVDLFRPLAFTPEQAADRRNAMLSVLGRRSSRTGTEGADFIARFGENQTKTFPELNLDTRWRSVPLQSTVADADFRLMLPLLVGLAGFVLLIACSNLANLMLVRTITRAREFAVRAALGASRLQLLRPLAFESLLLSLLGGVFAVLVALWVHGWLARQIMNENGETFPFHLDGRVLAWALLASALTAVAFGLAPALFALRLRLSETLKSGGHNSSGGRGQQRFRQFLVVGQFVLATVLLAGAVFFVRGLDRLHRRPAGWQAEGLVTGSIQLPATAYADPAKIATFQQAVLTQLGDLPGVASVGLSSSSPFFPWRESRKLRLHGQDSPAPGREFTATVNRVSPGYFETYQTRLRSGRVFGEHDQALALKVYLVDESTARALFGAEDPIGQRLGLLVDEQPQWGEIIGVVADVQPIDPGSNPGAHRVYLPLAEGRPRQFQFAVRTAPAAPGALVEQIRAAIGRLDPDVPLRRLQPAKITIDRELGEFRIFRDLLAAFGLLGLALASLGIYGVMARTTAQRSNEFAVRLAVGATARDITRLVLSAGLKQALLGAGIGLAGALGVTRLLIAAFPGISTNLPAVLLGTTLLLASVALLACWLPARRAGKIDAMQALRAE